MNKEELIKYNIFLKDSFISDEDCDFIRNFIDESNKNNNLNQEKWGPGSNVQCFYFNIEDINNCEMKVKIENIIYKKMILFQKELKEKYNIHTKGDSGYCLRKIYGSTRQHKDGTICATSFHVINNKIYAPIDNVRALSAILILNDDYEGCFFEFPRQEISLSLKKGQLIAFPRYWTHPHKVTEPLNGSYRYTINMWLYDEL
jgi:hypothetical protein